MDRLEKGARKGKPPQGGTGPHPSRSAVRNPSLPSSIEEFMART
jgi:hypothetical protein